MPRIKPLYILAPEAFFAGFSKQELEDELEGLRQERARVTTELKQVESDMYAVRSLIVKANCEERGATYHVKKRSYEYDPVDKLWAYK